MPAITPDTRVHVLRLPGATTGAPPRYLLARYQPRYSDRLLDWRPTAYVVGFREQNDAMTARQILDYTVAPRVTRVTAAPALEDGAVELVRAWLPVLVKPPPLQPGLPHACIIRTHAMGDLTAVLASWRMGLLLLEHDGHPLVGAVPSEEAAEEQEQRRNKIAVSTLDPTDGHVLPTGTAMWPFAGHAVFLAGNDVDDEYTWDVARQSAERALQLSTGGLGIP